VPAVGADVDDAVDAPEGVEVAGPVFHPMSGDTRIVDCSFTTRSVTTHDFPLELGADAYVKVAPDGTVDAQLPMTTPDIPFARE
jgi:hypothetical protein